MVNIFSKRRIVSLLIGMTTLMPIKYTIINRIGDISPDPYYYHLNA